MVSDNLIIAKLLNENMEWHRERIKVAEQKLADDKRILKATRDRRNRIIVAHIQGGLSVRAVAERLKMPVPTVASIYQAGK